MGGFKLKNCEGDWKDGGTKCGIHTSFQAGKNANE
jgi:hypothetical protein